MKFWLGVLVGIGISMIVVIVVGSILTHQLLQEQKLPDPALVLMNNDTRVDLNLSISELLTGKFADTNQFANKVVVLHFWEYWCVTCNQELISLEQLYSKTKDSTIVFAIISTMHRDRLKTDRAIHRIKLPFYYLESDLPSLFEDDDFPRTYIINRSGKLVVKEYGPRMWNTKKAIVLLDSLKHS